MADTLEEFRTERDAALVKTDCCYCPDLVERFEDGFMDALRIYRRDLRDATEGVTDENASEAVLPKPIDIGLALFLKIDIG